MLTLCSDCDHVHPDTRKLHPRRWLCLRCPNIVGAMGFVSDAVWVEHEPYKPCHGINGGACSMFEPMKEGKREKGTGI